MLILRDSGPYSLPARGHGRQPAARGGDRHTIRWRLYWKDSRLTWDKTAWNVSTIVVPATAVNPVPEARNFRLWLAEGSCNGRLEMIYVRIIARLL